MKAHVKVNTNKTNTKEVLVHVFNKNKYRRNAKCIRMHQYTITDYKVIEDREEARELEQYLGTSEIDENHEYLVLYLEDGNTATFRNTRVDMLTIKRGGVAKK